MIILTQMQADAIAEQRRAGRTDRQVERAVGLPYGTLSRPWTVPMIDPRAKAAAEKAFADWQRREDAFWRSVFAPRVTLRGWRPNGDCVRSRPNDAPHRSAPRRAQPPRHGKS